MLDNQTAVFLGPQQDRVRCRLTVSDSSQDGWSVFLDGEGRLAVVQVSYLALGPPPTERRFRMQLTIDQAHAMFARCIEHDLVALHTSQLGMRPSRPGEPMVTLTLRNPAGQRLELRKPSGMAIPALDAVVTTAREHVRVPHTQKPEYEGPYRAFWTPWTAPDT